MSRSRASGNSLQKWRLQSLVCVLMMSANSQVLAYDCQAAPVPYIANYSVTRKDKATGSMQMVLERKSINSYRYRMDTRVKLGIVHSRLQQRSDFSWKNGIFFPDSFRSTQQITFYKRTESVKFNWETLRATGTKKRDDFELEIMEGVQDKLTIYLFLASALCTGEDPVAVSVVSGPILKPHNYRIKAMESLLTKLGPLQTIHIRRGTYDSEKQTDMWLAEEIRFLPVKLVYRDDNDVISMDLIDISFKPDKPAGQTSLTDKK